MTGVNSAEHSKQNLMAEINRLCEEQIEAVRAATFVGMTEGEAAQFEARRTRILELLYELEGIISQRAA